MFPDKRKIPFLRFAGVLGVLFFAQILPGQNTLRLQVVDAETAETLTGATITQIGHPGGVTTDADGNASLTGISNGENRFSITYAGYQTDTLVLVFPLPGSATETIVRLKSAQSDIGEVTIFSTRTNARIEDQPTKIEVLGLEELNEENGIKPANIGSLLGDLSVIQIQQTSAVSGGSAVRMQGLDGKYTQLLRDGLPLYEGFTGGLGILQIPPLDLQQVEIIKGSVSTLYGGGAISGMINLVSKRPSSKPEWTLTANQSTLKESNLNTWFSKKYGRVGVTFFGGSILQQGVDVNNDGFSDVARVRGLILHPRLFWDGTSDKFDVGYSGTFEQRNGGSMSLLSGESNDVTNLFVEKNHTQRQTIDGHWEHKFAQNWSFNAKTAFSFLNLTTLNSTRSGFKGHFLTGYSDASLLKKWKRNDLVMGVNLVNQSFNGDLGTTALAAFDNITYGTYIQDTWHPVAQWTLEGGFRADKTNNFGALYLPRISVLFKPASDWSVRLGSGSGYRLPDVFTDGGQAFLPLTNTAKAEQSTGVNFDGNWNHLFFEKLGVTVNQAFYYVGIAKPVIVGNGNLTNSTGSVQTLGADTYVRVDIHPVELYLGYNHTIAQHFDANKKAENYLYYSPQDKFAMTAAFEPGDKWRFGIESAWVANQYKNDNTKAKNYWFIAAMMERKFKHFAVVLNGENLGDFRQSRFEPLFDGPTNQPVFRSLWAPIDGRVVNLSVKWHII